MQRAEMNDTDPSRSQTSYLFVYGTLKRGFCRADWMCGQRFVGEARTAPMYRMFDCGSYPGLVESPGDGVSIEGEVWEVDGECLARLDEVEGVELNLYARQQIEMQTPFDQDAVETYIFQRSVVGMVDCGVAWTPA